MDNILLKSERMFRSTASMSIPTIFTNTVLEVLASVLSVEKKKRYPDQKQRNKTLYLQMT